MSFLPKICIAWVSTLALLAGPSCATLTGASAKSQQWVEIAASALDEGDTSGALQSLAKAEDYDDKNPSLHHVRALAYLQRKELAAATVSAKIAHELAPTDSTIATTYGKILMDAGRELEAERALLPAANDTLYRDSYRARTNLAIIYMKRGKAELAMDQLERAINESPIKACHAYYFRSQMRLKSGAMRDSLKDLEHATSGVCASLAEAHLGLGIALAKDRQYQRARSKFVEISQRFPGTDIAEKARENLGYLP